MVSSGTTRLGGRVGRGDRASSRDRLYRDELLDLRLVLHQVGKRDAAEKLVDALLQRLPDGTDTASAPRMAPGGVDGMRFAVDLERLVLRRGHHVPHRDVRGIARQEVAPPCTPDALDEPGTAQPQEDLLDVVRRKAFGLGELTRRDRTPFRRAPAGKVQDDDEAV